MNQPSLQPRAYRRPVSTWWWLERRSYFVFVMRELSSIFVAWAVVFLLMLAYAVGRGDGPYQDFLDWAASPWVVLLNVVTLAFLVLHTVTWFSLTPQAMVVRVGGRRLPAAAVIASQYVGLVVVWTFVVWLVTR
jgi:fumarate reductase subunit C